jgi:pimeloyl-ACP methyl ester carboxylesterase
MKESHLEYAVTIHEGSVHSADGTRIGYHRLGSGPALIFVHGSVATHTDWMRVAKLLAPKFTCFVMDRRGRCRSGVGISNYSLEREYEDIEALLAVTGPGTGLAAHSYGAVCALGAAMRNPVRGIVLYEPPFPVNGPVASENLARYSNAIAQGDLDEAMQIGLAEFLRLHDKEIVELRSTRAWPRLRTLAVSWVRELEAIDNLSPDLERYSTLACPSMMLMGSLSPEHPLQNSSRALAKVLPGVLVVKLEGYDHMAMRTNPELISRLVTEFFANI